MNFYTLNNQSNNKYKDTFITQDKDYIIELSRTNLSLFQENNSNRYICTLTFKNNLGNIIKTINMSDIDISILIDNIYIFLDIEEEISVYIKSCNILNPDYIIKINLNAIKDNYGNFLKWKYIFNLMSYSDEMIIPILSFDLSDSMYEFIDKLYNLYLSDSNIPNIEQLNPNQILNRDFLENINPNKYLEFE